MKYLIFVLTVHAALATRGAAAADLLTIGSPAPALNVDTWVKGEPVRGIEKGQVYVIEFWGTNCGPCIRCMPHLSDLQRQHQGVKFMCLSNEPEQAIRSFVAKNDQNMGFRVGWDEKGGMWKSWMDAARLAGIPTAFIVDNTAKIVWIGNPAEIDEPLLQVLEGRYDPSANLIALRLEHARDKASEKSDERLERGNRLANQIENLILNHRTAEAVALAEQAIQNEPGERVWYGELKLQSLVADTKLADQALAYGIELAAAVAARLAENHKPADQELLDIAFTLVSPIGDNAQPNPGCCDLALEIVKLAGVIASQDQKSHERDQVDQRIRIESILGQVCAGKGEFNKAVAHAKRAIEICRSALPPPNGNEKWFRQDMANWAKTLEVNTLATYQKKAPTAPEK